jgi:hypothetical protein
MLAELESDTYRDAPLRDKVEYWHLMNEVELADWKFVLECPAMIARRHELDSGSSSC